MGLCRKSSAFPAGVARRSSFVPRRSSDRFAIPLCGCLPCVIASPVAEPGLAKRGTVMRSEVMIDAGRSANDDRRKAHCEQRQRGIDPHHSLLEFGRLKKYGRLVSRPYWQKCLRSCRIQQAFPEPLSSGGCPPHPGMARPGVSGPHLVYTVRGLRPDLVHSRGRIDRMEPARIDQCVSAAPSLRRDRLTRRGKASPGSRLCQAGLELAQAFGAVAAAFGGGWGFGVDLTDRHR